MTHSIRAGLFVSLAATLAATVAGLPPAPALAQSDDVSYCQALSAKYVRYATNKNGGRHGGQAPVVGVDTAMARCAIDPAGSIPVLEQALTNNRLELPHRM